ncbi:MAG: hypothetical protein IJX77_07260 [Ruminococcus sp.]|nr:hypothetical protein [Ruminococcus sp.]
MKKMLSFISAAAICLTAAPFCVSAAENTNALDLKYDMNLDGVVDKADMVALYVYLGFESYVYQENPILDEEGIIIGWNEKTVKNEITEETAANIEANGDVNEDGTIDGLDGQALFYLMLDEGVIPTDFNFDGKFDYYDSEILLEYYSSIQTKSLVINEDGTYTCNKNIYDFSDEQIKFIMKHGDINANDKTDVFDATELLIYLYSDKIDGDLNMDGSINALDASLVLEYYSKDQTNDSKDQTNAFGSRITPEESAGRNLGDFNGDGEINALDASDIMASYAKAQTA